MLEEGRQAGRGKRSEVLPSAGPCWVQHQPARQQAPTGAIVVELQLIGFEAYSEEEDPMLGTVILVKSHDWGLCLVFYPYVLLAFCSLFFFSLGVLPPNFQIDHSCGA